MKRFLIFSGHNDRAVVALCRFFDAYRLPFVIVAAGLTDAIHRTRWADQVVCNRVDAVVSVGLFEQVLSLVDGPLVYCPTTEFINHFVLRHRQALIAIGLDIGLPEQGVYDTLTGKASSQAMVTAISPELRLPAMQAMDALQVPCVLKPRENVAGGRVRYPLLCRTAAELAAHLKGLDTPSYFAQDFIVGQSLYLCAYLARDGRMASFWQTNLMQQGGGKSIVLARPGANPGFDDTRLLAGLHAGGYHGPFMMEVIQTEGEGGLYYIEVNPRFWGPLQLALDVCPAILTLFAQDHGFDVQPAAVNAPMQAVYAWLHGARQPACVRHPAAQALDDAQIEHLLSSHDVYARADTQALHGVH